MTAREWQQSRTGYAFTLPYMLFFLVITAYPLGRALFLGFQEWTVGGTPHWVGLANYQQLMHDQLFWKTLGNTLYFVVFETIGQVTVPMVIAIAMNEVKQFRTLYRTAFFLPAVTSWVVVSLVWESLFSHVGLINHLLTLIWLDPQPFLSSPTQAMPAIIVTSVWKNIGIYSAIYLAALQAVPQGLYEAARMDGAGVWAQHRYITLPMIRPTIVFVAMVSVIRGMQLFTQPFVMTEGGPLNSTMSVVMYIYRLAFVQHKFGYASAVAVAVFVLLAGLSLGLRLVTTRTGREA